MTSQADIFDPDAILVLLTELEPVVKRDRFQMDWRRNVENRYNGWKSTNDSKVPDFQLKWEAAVVEYVDYIHKRLSYHANTSAKNKETPRVLKKEVPLLGPYFIPPSYLYLMRRSPTPFITPESAYIAAFTVIHPVFYPHTFTKCPHCDSSRLLGKGWNATGGRNVLGVRKNERALGYQLQCLDCKEKDAPTGYCTATTNQVFWEKWHHWKIPRSIPYFFHRTAVTHELFDLVIELRPSSTSAGLSENIKQLHLLEYRERMLEYLTYFKSCARPNLFKKNNLQNFSAPTDETGYNDSFITNDLITDIYLEFVLKIRQKESIEYCKTRSAQSISMDNTFKSAGKATLVAKDGERQNPLKGGILSAINEEGEGLTWRFCASASPSESEELLTDLAKRHDIMNIDRPRYVIVDNCCQVRRFVQRGLGPDTKVLLDVYHFIMRYGAVVYGGAKNPNRREVLKDVRDAIIKRPAKANQPALYWTQEEQVTRIEEMYKKWVDNGNVWSNAASKVHDDQLDHVRLGCLARPRDDIPMDGSRIEGSHKAWNSLQRAQPSGIEVYTGLAHDFFLRRNIRIASARLKGARTVNYAEFLKSTHSSHHLGLVHFASDLFNSIHDKEVARIKHPLAGVTTYPILPQMHIKEMVGLVKSNHMLSFGGHMPIEGLKEELPSPDLDAGLLEDIDSEITEIGYVQFMESLNLKSMEDLRIKLSARSKVLPNATPIPNSSTLASKRKERTDIMTDESTTDGLPHTKRRRHTEALMSPSIAAPASPPSPDAPLQHEGYPESEDALQPETQMECLSDTRAGSADLEDCGLNGASVISADVRLPSVPLSAETNGHVQLPVHAMFQFQNSSGNKSIPTSKVLTHNLNDFEKPAALNQSTVGAGPSKPPLLSSHSKNLAAPIISPLPLSIPSTSDGLTRSQRLFSLATSLDPRSLLISEDNEFWLFMDMRAEFQWTTFGMTSAKWASATRLYNERLEAVAKEKKFMFIRKNPRALMDKLSVIEPKITERISKGIYTSKRSQYQSDTFWKKHCTAVSAIIKREDVSSTRDVLKKPRKLATCQRCMKIMYPPGCKALNHKKGVCADGVAQIVKDGALDTELPDWPQPQGMFSGGDSFNPSIFLLAVRNIYERVVESGAAAVDLTLEEQAFSRMLGSRTRTIDGHPFFLLYDDLKFIGGSFDSLISELDGRRYLRLDCLYSA